MGFEFAETMSGTIEWDTAPGRREPFSFEVRAHAASTRAHMRDGRAELHGIVHAPPRAAAADATGWIVIRPIGQRVIRYELTFTADDGTPLTLTGQKDIRWLAPFKTFTELPAEIHDDTGHRVARCDTRFDLRHDGWSFLRSFRPA